MKWLTKFLDSKDKIDREIEDELHFHVESRIERSIRAGMSPEEARRKALERFGNIDLIREKVRQIDAGYLDTVWQDVRYAIRTLRNSPGLTAVAVLSLALGIGLNSTIFSAINAVLLRPLPYKDPDQIVYIGQGFRGGWSWGMNPVNYLAWEKHNKAFEAMAAVFPFHHNVGRYGLIKGNAVVPIQTLRVSASFFQVLGVQPAFGRGFLPEEDQPGVHVVILSHDLFRREFGSDPSVIGRDIALDDASYRVVGVLPEGFRYLHRSGDVDVWLSNPFEAIPRTNRFTNGLRPIARLRTGISIEQARAEMQVIARSLEREYPKENKGILLGAGPLLEMWTSDHRPQLLLLLGAVGLVLLIACGNVANLLLARGGARKQEIAMRTALGASRPRLIRQLLTESLLIGLGAGAAGLLLAMGSLGLLKRILPDMLFRLDETNMDARVLGFTLLISLLTAILFGLAPAITGTRVEIMDVLKGGGRNDSGNRAGSRLQGGLVVVQVALSLVLLTGAGLMINTLSRLHNIRLGFKPQNLLTVLCVMPPSQPAVTDLGIKPESRNAGSDKRRHYLANPAAVNFATRVAERLERVPGVKSASGVGIDFPFLIRPHFPFPFRMEEQVSLTPEERRTQSPWFSTITTNYFRTMGIPLVEGRAFDERDGENTPGVAIVSQAMAKKFWPRERTVIGKRITISPRSRPFEIVGLAADVRMSPKQDKEGQMYVPDVQFWEPSYSDLDLSQRVEFQFVLRTESEPAALAAAVRKAIEEVSPMQPVDRFLTMEEVLAKAFGPWSSTMVLLGLFAAVALLLSAIGIYGVMSYTVSRRKYEIGVRMALGASGGDVLRMMMKSGFLLAVAGVVAGSIAAYWLTRFIAGQLFEVKATDPLTFASGVGILMVVALVAAYVPARRATRLDPLAALRSE